jgi:cobalt/nickel transport system ATP-binding protein
MTPSVQQSNGVTLELRNVSYRYPGAETSALQEISLSLAPGQRCALLGPNGSGKTTLLQMGNGLLRPDTGTVIWNGHPVGYDRASIRAWRREAGFIFQETDAQLLTATVVEDVAFGPTNLGWSRAEVGEAVDRALSLCGCAEFAHRAVHELSSGQRKRVAIAGVVAMHPRLILADEPWVHLDPSGCDAVLDVFESLHREGVGFLIATHDLSLVRVWFDTAAVLLDGRLVQHKAAAEIASDTELLTRSRLVSRYGLGA